MSLVQAEFFLAILLLVTVRTLLFKRVVNDIDPDATSLCVGLGTVASCVALWSVLAVLSRAPALHSDPGGIAAGVVKGTLLAVLMGMQQRLIGRSLSATTYTFPIAIGFIAVVESWAFGTRLAAGGIAAIAILFSAGVSFAMFGHLASMQAADKRRFAWMIAIVVGFAICDKVGIPRIGWLPYLFWTGVGNVFAAWCVRRRLFGIRIRPLLFVGAIWALPELFFNFSLQTILPVAFGYLAIALRVPLLLGVSAVLYGEGKLREQLAFGAVAVVGVALLFIG
ncbi:hypothetical protein SB397_26010 [Burkholderia multivorans]|uniref:hypothetical protein n=1 Tax=Burkholderia multivorans TaxID=87883 RepID=UPI0012DA5104|nr:hypothetical protein [Burkholderia multivorans]MBU9560577.1 hypothetical protein [Burkholderia multivorans]MEB2489034.1 hypothetical protein [Burkholderia multivorans]MEB2568229.1 hypothetical protein [Burkholderia multivorans]